MHKTNSRNCYIKYNNFPYFRPSVTRMFVFVFGLILLLRLQKHDRLGPQKLQIVIRCLILHLKIIIAKNKAL